MAEKARMQQARRDRSSREQLFLIAVGVFLLTYLITLTRTRSLEWVVLASTVALGITIAAGLLITDVIAAPPAEETDTASKHDQPNPLAGTQVDFTLPADDLDDDLMPRETE